MLQNSFKKRNINEVVVVEGKTDTSHLKRLFNVRTIETNGSALNKKTINLIIAAAKNQGVILFLDPDYAGEKIRREIIGHLKGLNYKEAFITQKEWLTFKKGVSEANDQAVVDAILQAASIDNSSTPSITWDEYNVLPLHTYEARQKLCDKLKISYANHKQLFNRLNMMHLTKKEIEDLIYE